MNARICRLLLCAALVTLPATITPRDATAGVSWSISVFDGPLAVHGHWIDRAPYGRCWYPGYVAAGWRPYCDGYWMWTDYGWYWYSDEPWAWATYHYGRWVYDPYYGWIWVPGTEWGPSWVSWREGGGYVGWAPLPPACDFGPTGVLIVREAYIPPSFFVFVHVNRFCDPIRPRTVIINNTTIINKTVNITHVKRVNNVVVNHGPKVEVVEKVSTRKFTEAPRVDRRAEPRVESRRQPTRPAPKIIRPEPTPTPTPEKPAVEKPPVVKQPEAKQPETKTWTPPAKSTPPSFMRRSDESTPPPAYNPYRRQYWPPSTAPDSVHPRTKYVPPPPPSSEPEGRSPKADRPQRDESPRVKKQPQQQPPAEEQSNGRRNRHGRDERYD